MNKIKKKHKYQEIIKFLRLIIFLITVTCLLKICKHSNVNTEFFIGTLTFISLIIFLYKKKYYEIFNNEIKELYAEIQHVKWPGFKETFYMNVLIIFLITIISLFLWGLDNCILKIMSYITSFHFKN